jgi:hypothetical protein
MILQIRTDGAKPTWGTSYCESDRHNLRVAENRSLSTAGPEGVRLVKLNDLTTEFPPQPRLRQAQIVPHNMDRLAERFRCLLRGHPPEVTHFDQLGQRLVFLRERIQNSIQIQKLDLFDAEPPSTSVPVFSKNVAFPSRE